jgi:hypothetical protein
MPRLSQEEKGYLNMAGEFLVAAELNRRQILSAVTYGNSKSADVWAFSSDSRRAARIEVKTTREGRNGWVTGDRSLIKDGWDKELFWVLVLLPPPQSDGPPNNDADRGRHVPRFFVFTAKDIGELVTAGDQKYRQNYLARHNRKWTGKGVPKVFLGEAAPFENQWKKIEAQVWKTSPK